MAEAPYSRLERILHHAALNKFVGEASFDLERTLSTVDVDAVADQPHIFIAGLARSGSTALLEALYGSGILRSLTYLDMPFVLMPGLWRRLRGQTSARTPKAERAHGDGLLVGVKSPEALEEVFWRVFAGSDYIKPDCLVPHEADDALIAQFRAYVALILASDTSQSWHAYLSKNNNNILRLGTITRALPSAVLVIPFRDPLQQALSLQRQHVRFSELQASDRFAARYMSWLAHHEFGGTHRPFCFAQGDRDLIARLDPAHTEYWLAIWISAYRYVLKSAPQSALFVDHADMCRAPARILEAIGRQAGLTLDAGQIPDAFTPPERTPDRQPHAELLREATQTFEALRARKS